MADQQYNAAGGLTNYNAAGGLTNYNADGGIVLSNLGNNNGNGNPNSYGGYGYGSGGGSSAKAQEETQAQIDNTAGNYANRAEDLNKLGQQNLESIQSQLNQNQALYDSNRRQAMQQVEWQPNQQKEQSTLSAMRDRMGNAAYGSSLADLMEGMGRVDDMNDVSLINAWKQNSNAAYDNWFQANEDLIADYIDQMTAIEDEFSKLYSQYWSTMSNINPLLATRENLEKSRNGESVTVGEGTDAYTLPSDIRLEPNDALRALLVAPERASAVNPYTRSYVRPDRSVNAALAIGSTGARNVTTAANRGFADDLGVYDRRV